jgi:hypothetical protein
VQTNLTSLTTWLQQFGIWGYVAMAALPVVTYYLRKRYSTATPTPVPSPNPNPATQPALLAGLSPLLSDLLTAAGIVPSAGATVADVPHTTALQLMSDAKALVGAKKAASQAAVDDLTPAAATTLPTLPAAKS